MAGRTILQRGQESEEKELTVLVQVDVEVLLGLELPSHLRGVDVLEAPLLAGGGGIVFHVTFFFRFASVFLRFIALVDATLLISGTVRIRDLWKSSLIFL